MKTTNSVDVKIKNGKEELGFVTTKTIDKSIKPVSAAKRKKYKPVVVTTNNMESVEKKTKKGKKDKKERAGV